MNIARMPGRVPVSRAATIAAMRRRTATATSFCWPARPAMTKMPPPAVVTARCASGPNSWRSRGIRPSSSACAAASISGSRRSTAASSPSARRCLASIWLIRACKRGQHCLLRLRMLQAEREGQLEDVAPGMRAQPGLQLRIDPVHQAEPGAAMHPAALLGRHNVAGDFRLVAAAGDQQVERRVVLQPGEADVEAARPLQRAGTQQMEQRDQAFLPGQAVAGTALAAGSCRRPTGWPCSSAASAASAAIRRSASVGVRLRAPLRKRSRTSSIECRCSACLPSRVCAAACRGRPPAARARLPGRRCRRIRSSALLSMWDVCCHGQTSCAAAAARSGRPDFALDDAGDGRPERTLAWLLRPGLRGYQRRDHGGPSS